MASFLGFFSCTKKSEESNQNTSEISETDSVNDAGDDVVRPTGDERSGPLDVEDSTVDTTGSEQ